MTKFNVGDKVMRVNPDDGNSFWNEPDDNLFHGRIYTVSYCDEYNIDLVECRNRYKPKYFQLVKSATTPDTQVEVQEQHTQSELSYINQLEDRVELLESLCHDYAEQINQLNHKLVAQAANIVVGVEREGVQHKPTGVFKPIKDYTNEDWELALEQNGVFLDNIGKELTLEKVWDEDGEVCFVETHWLYDHRGMCKGDNTYITERIK